MPQYPTASPGTSLVAIQQKVRMLTRSPSEAQLSTDMLNNYINTFVLQDFPAILKTFQLRTTFTFWCNPYQDYYQLDIQSFGGATNAGLNSLYNFQNLYPAIHQPVFIAGFPAGYTQNRQEFYNNYPTTNFIQSIGYVGDNTTRRFVGTIQFGGTINNQLNNQTMSLLKRNVTFSSVDVNSNGLSMVDVPVLDRTTGVETIYGNLYVAGQQPTTPAAPPTNLGPIQPPLADAPYLTHGVDQNNYINYATGEFVVTFAIAPKAGQAINSQTVPTIPSRPFGMLYHNNAITIRPVPDQPYAINFEVDAAPTQLFNQNSVPQLAMQWQYIAYGAAIKVLQDRTDAETVALLMPEFERQENFCNRPTLVQLANSRTPTPYSGTTGDNFNQNNQGFGYGGSW